MSGQDTPVPPKTATKPAARVGAMVAPLRRALNRVVASAGARPMRTVRLLGIIAAVLVVLSGALWWAVARHSAAEAARDQAQAAAKDAVVALLSYNFTTIDHQVADTDHLLTGKFKNDYAQLVKTTIGPGAKERQLAIQTAVVSDSVVSADPGKVVLLMFINQQSVSSASPTPSATGARIRITLQHEQGKWLISDLGPV
jgi:Mce-associated membrane protein